MLPNHLLIAALHAVVTQRCERAYAHELKNSLQGVYAGLDAFGRLLEGKIAPTVSADRVKQVARAAAQNHEQSLMHTLEHLVLRQDSPAAVDLAGELRQTAMFLNNDATRRGVVLGIDNAPGAVRALARPSALRLALLAATTRSIDTMSGGGELKIAALVDNGAIARFTLAATNSMLDAWRIDALTEEHWVDYALNALIRKEGGSLQIDSPSDRQRTVTLRFQTAGS